MKKSINLNGLSWSNISKYLSGEANSQECQTVEEWIRASEENYQYFSYVKSIWDNAVDPLEYEEFNASKGLMEVRAKLKGKNISRGGIKQFSINKYIYRAAAVLIVLLSVGSLLYYYHVDELVFNPKIAISSRGETKEILLPDSSVVTLAQYSWLEYPKFFKRKQRVVELRGKAFFNITENKSKPFVVNTIKAAVQVVGTSFEVFEQSDRSNVSVTVETGLVRLSEKGYQKNCMMLEPGTKGVFINSSSQIEKIEHADLNAIAWKTKRFLFEKTTLSEVATLLEQAYGIKINVAESLKGKEITASFNNKSIESIIEIINITLHINAKRINGSIEVTESNID